MQSVQRGSVQILAGPIEARRGEEVPEEVVRRIARSEKIVAAYAYTIATAISIGIWVLVIWGFIELTK